MSDWKYNWFGFWRASSKEMHLPKIEDWLDSQWNPEDKIELLKYVEKSPVVVASATPKTQCLMCGQRLAASIYQSDGVWLWPEDLNHYIKNHGVRLPESLIAHIRSKNYKCPREVNVALENLPWPG